VIRFLSNSVLDVAQNKHLNSKPDCITVTDLSMTKVQLPSNMFRVLLWLGCTLSTLSFLNLEISHEELTGYKNCILCKVYTTAVLIILSHRDI